MIDLIKFLEVGLTIYIINLPFGYWRRNVPRGSLQWVGAIHIPVPFIFLLRMAAGFGWETIPLFVVFFFTGQLTGGKIWQIMNTKIEVTSCLIKDLFALLTIEEVE
ncbi:MAG: hypothetical protein ACP6IP_02865 [Candidatus Njordarchaeia archaeon]